MEISRDWYKWQAFRRTLSPTLSSATTMAIAAIRQAEHISPEELYSVFQGLASQNPQLIKASEKRFKAMLDMFGTFDALNAIATSRNLPLAVRQQSIIQFKNAALGHWKSRKFVILLPLASIVNDIVLLSRLLSDEQRVVIRRRSLELIDEEDEIVRHHAYKMIACSCTYRPDCFV